MSCYVVVCVCLFVPTRAKYTPPRFFSLLSNLQRSILMLKERKHLPLEINESLTFDNLTRDTFFNT